MFSTCGGTGSALAFDVAYLCQHLLRGSNPTIIGVALLPPVIDKAIKNETQTQREKIRANTYAWFKESDHLLENPHWRVAYPEGAPANIQAPPFDLQFVVDLGNQANQRLNSEDDIYTMVAQAVFLDTGSPIAGAIRGFNANVGVLLEEFRGRQRAYSSLAAASLVYPKERILNYCSARLGQAMIRHGLLAVPDSNEVGEATSALLGRQRLRDAQVLESLLADRHVPNTNAPAIRKATSVEAIRRLLATQEGRDGQARQRQTERIANTAASLLIAAQGAFETEVMTLASKWGVPFARGVLDRLTAERADDEPVPESTLSLLGFKVRLDQEGIHERDLSQAEREYQAARERLRALEGGFWRGMRKRVRSGAWKQDLDRARNDCLHWMSEVNQRTLQLAAQREATNLYDQLAEEARGLKGSLARVVQALERTVEDLEQVAEDNLKPATAEEGIFEMTQEAVDAAYIRDYYPKHAANVDPVAAYQVFAQGFHIRDLADPSAELRTGPSDGLRTGLARALRKHAEGYFAEDLENISLLEALVEYYGDNAPAVIEARFDRLVRFCHPFWQFNKDSGLQGHEGKSIIGVEDEHSELIPPKYRDSLQYEIKSTGFKHRVDVARIQHGLPAFLLRGMQDYRAYYDAKRKGLDPLHILPEAALADEVIPEEKQEARELFAVAAAFDYIVQIGSWYYFDLMKEYETSHIHPGRENRLDQGREKAEDAFIQRDDLVRQAEVLVEREIEAMGNRAAIALLDARIAERVGRSAGAIIT
ncbi:MAG: tubulin-like doman-containing protein, partial [Candidatus Binatia bacterium]